MNTLPMSHSRVAFYDATVLGAEVEVEEGKSNDETLVFSYSNPDFVCPITDQQQQQQQQNEEGSDPCDCDSVEGDLIIPIYSVNTDYSPEQNKAKRECSPPTDDDGGRKRVKFLPHHITMLEDLFLQSQYPTTEVREKLEQQLGVSENRILVWFQNRRAKEKREAKRLQKIRNARKQIDSKLLPPSFWPTDLSFNSPLRHITPLERRSITEVQTPISEVVEDPINFIPPVAPIHVPVISARPLREHNPACSYNSTCMVPLHNDIQYTPVDFPVTTIKSVTIQALPPYLHQPQTEPIHVEQTQWQQPLYPNLDTVNYPYSISNYLPVQTPFQGQGYPWFSSNTAFLQNQTAPASIYVREQYPPSNCNKVYCTPCKETY